MCLKGRGMVSMVVWVVWVGVMASAERGPVVIGVTGGAGC